MKWTLPVLLVLAGPAEGQNVTETLINPYYYCVGKAAGRQPDRYKRPEEAIERAFAACQTEELAIRSYGEMSGLSPYEVNQVIAVQRGRLKRTLVQELTR